MACPQKGLSNHDEDEDGRAPGSTAGCGALRPGASLRVTPPELEGAGQGAGGEAWTALRRPGMGRRACRPPVACARVAGPHRDCQAWQRGAPI